MGDRKTHKECVTELASAKGSKVDGILAQNKLSKNFAV